jgi:bile acid-coenzyme A ligase
MAKMSHGRAMTWLAERDPGGIALVHEGASATRASLERRSNALARSYRALGVGADDLVTLALPNGIEFFEACLAVWKLGATPQPISTRLPELERRAIVELADPKLVVGVPPGSYGERPCVAPGFAPEPALSDAPLEDVVPRCVRAMTSGGSTGRPKLILDTTPAECDPEAAENAMQPGGTTLVPGPLYHAGPFITSWQQLLMGGRVILMSRFDAREACELVERHRVDWVLFVPTMMQRIWRLPDRERFDLSSLRRVMCTGAPSPEWLKRAWIGWLGPEKIYEAYGGTERSGGTMISGTEWLARPGSVGRPTGGRKIRVLRADGAECATGEVGEIFMLPPGGQGSTYRYVGAEAKATAGGWETLGDLGTLDADGYLYVVDRRTDLIVTGGANVYPAEVEAALDAHPAVRSSCVVGLPDDDLGQRVHAIVDAPAPPGEAELREHLAKHLVRYKIPRSFEFVNEVLRDDAGKVRRSALREARLGGRASETGATMARERCSTR